MAPVVRGEIGGLVAGPDHFGMSVQKNGGLDFPRVHVGEQRGAHPGPDAGLLPVLGGREERDVLAPRGGLLNHVAQHVVAAVAVDDDQGRDARAAQRVRDVPYHRMKGHRGDADGPRPGRVLVRAGDRHRWKEVHGIRVGDLPGDGTGDQRVGRQRQERAVLLETPHRQDGDLP
ncbi:hypothetical protein GCM10010510_40730 [Streptomyces anandii JCM 4720]|nr:hypothetical protein GCM10010510_40730 [Streptomyces anandii JCM 4720]